MAIFSFFTKAELRAGHHPLLDASLLEEPSRALAQAQLVSEGIVTDIILLADFVCNLPTNYKKGSGDAVKAEGMRNTIASHLNELEDYLLHITHCSLSAMDSNTAKQLLLSLNELHDIAEHLLHIARISKAISKQKHPLSFPAQKELAELWSRINTILQKLEEAFLKGNSITSMWMLRQNSMIQEQIKDLKKNHIRRLRSGKCRIETGIFFLDLLYDYEQIAKHCTTLFNETFIMDHLEERKG